MKKLLVVFLLISCALFAQEKTETFVIARTAIGNNAYNLVEVFQGRGRWIFPDVGYIDFNDANKYREIFIGGGGILYKSKNAILIHEVYLDQATGPLAASALYFQPWTLFSFQISEKVSWETVYFPYFPLNKAGRVQHVLERSKVERDFKHWKLGLGYSGYQFAYNDWDHKPFFTTTLKTRAGEFEFWFQRVPNNHGQLQMRYAKTFR